VTRSYQGIGVSPGVVKAAALVLKKQEVGVFRVPIRPDRVEAELERFRQAVAESRVQLETVKKDLTRRVGDHYACIFDAQILILQDRMFVGRAEEMIRSDQVNAEWALQEVVTEVRHIFRDLKDPYIRERVGDVEDLYERMLHNLTGHERHDLSELEEDVIVVSHNLNPSDTASLNTDHVVGFVTDVGGETSHTAILALSLEVPAVLGLHNISEEVATGDVLVVDGEEGSVHVDPSPEVVSMYYGRRREVQERENRYLASREEPAVTLDGVEVALRANLELPAELESVLEYGARGIGLYRSEFLFVEKSPDLPTEDDHYEIYKMLAQKVAPDRAIIRTIDLGGEKYYHEVLEQDESNPVMGMRGIRLSLRHEDIFRTQLRGVLRASTVGDIWLMFPLVSGVSELVEGRRHLEAAMEELEKEGVPYRPDIPVGIMVEVPSAAQIADLLARRADFLSIGTNDLIQYALAVDRGNENVAYLYRPLHPAVLRMLRFVVRAGEEEDAVVSVCGEMAANPLHAVVLLGLGVRDLSMNPHSIPLIKETIRGIEAGEVQEIAERALTMDTAVEISRFVRQALGGRIPEKEKGVRE